MDNQSVTPADVFADLLRFGAPAAVAWVKGGASAPAISGLVKFYQTPYQGVLVEAEIFNLPNKETVFGTAVKAFCLTLCILLFFLYSSLTVKLFDFICSRILYGGVSQHCGCFGRGPG